MTRMIVIASIIAVGALARDARAEEVCKTTQLKTGALTLSEKYLMATPVTPKRGLKPPGTPVSADNPVAQVAGAFLRAAHAGDVAAMKKTLTPQGANLLDSRTVR